MDRSTEDARVADVLRFLQGRKLRDCQRITLPNGHVIPGADRRKVADQIFPQRLDGQTVLEVGCDYGFFLHEAVARGAARAVGIEANDATFAVADRIASLWNGRVEIRQGRFPDLPLDETFDYVLCLNVLHHTPDPWALMTKAAALSRRRLAVEFSLPTGAQFWCDSVGTAESVLTTALSIVRFYHRVRHRLYAKAFGSLAGTLPLIAVGSVPGGRSFYFTQAAFEKAFTIHHPIAARLEFRDSPGKELDRRIALFDRDEARTAR